MPRGTMRGHFGATYSSTMGLPARPCALLGRAEGVVDVPGILVRTLPAYPLTKSQGTTLNSTNSIETHQTTGIQRSWESLTQRRSEGSTYPLRRTDTGLARACTETSCALQFLEDEIDEFIIPTVNCSSFSSPKFENYGTLCPRILIPHVF